MQRFIMVGLTSLTLATVFAPVANAEQSAINPYVAGTATTAEQLSPAELVSLANQGYFQKQGIPARTGLASAYRLGSIAAKDVIEGAVKANRLPPEVADDLAYTTAVDNQLQVVNLNF